MRYFAPLRGRLGFWFAILVLTLVVGSLLGGGDRPTQAASEGPAHEIGPARGNPEQQGVATPNRGRPDRPLIEFELLSPTSPPNRDTVLPDSGWPLAVRLVATGDPYLSTLVARSDVPSDYPEKDLWGFILWDDPDGCLSWSPSCPDLPADETVLQFRAGEREPDGIGPSPDLPALVLLADTGVGWDDEGDVLRGLNLSALAATVAYELNDVRRRTNVLVEFVVPFGPFAPRVDEDSCLGNPATCDGSARYQVRGFEGETFDVDLQGKCTIYRKIFNERFVTLRLFVLKLPPFQDENSNEAGLVSLEDFDGNGVVDIHDAELQGYELLSEELVVEFRQLLGVDPGSLFIRSVDLDGNGVAIGPEVPCPDPTPSPVGAKKPPR